MKSLAWVPSLAQMWESRLKTTRACLGSAALCGLTGGRPSSTQPLCFNQLLWDRRYSCLVTDAFPNPQKATLCVGRRKVTAQGAPRSGLQTTDPISAARPPAKLQTSLVTPAEPGGGGEDVPEGGSGFVWREPCRVCASSPEKLTAPSVHLLFGLSLWDHMWGQSSTLWNSA